jgi:UDP-N-acetyl-D-glucosamine/UDP-N-acetyl-D-galactosamine dehydrogenase
VVSGCTSLIAVEIAKVYQTIIKPEIYIAPSIKVAESSKMVENIQRDLNISLMNELSIIFDKLEIDTQEVLSAASTKWNFHKYQPGLVGGHCIGVDPYYLIYKARQVGLDPKVIAAGRSVNDQIPKYIAKKLVQHLIEKKKSITLCKVLIMGLTFKENTSDIRKSKVVDLIKELKEYSLNVDVCDPLATPKDALQYYNIDLTSDPVDTYDAIIVSVAHDQYRNLQIPYFQSISKDDLVLFDLKGMYHPGPNYKYWRL